MFPGPNSSSAGRGDLNNGVSSLFCEFTQLQFFFFFNFKMLHRYFCLFKFSVGAAVFMEYILGVSYNAKYFTCNQISQQSHKVNTLITLLLRMRKLKPRVGMWDHWGLNSSLPDSESSNWTYDTTCSLHMVVSWLFQWASEARLWSSEARSWSLQSFISWPRPDKTLQVF